MLPSRANPISLHPHIVAPCRRIQCSCASTVMIVVRSKGRAGVRGSRGGRVGSLSPNPNVSAFSLPRSTTVLVLALIHP